MALADSLRVIALVGCLVLVGGCATAPTRTAGTRDKPVAELATVHIRQHDGLAAWHGQPIHISIFYLDTAPYPIRRDRDFLLLPGKQTLGIDYGSCVHGVEAAFSNLSVDNELYGGPFGRFDVTLEPGAHYELVAEDKLTGKNAVQTEHALRRFDPTTRPTR